MKKSSLSNLGIILAFIFFFLTFLSCNNPTATVNVSNIAVIEGNIQRLTTKLSPREYTPIIVQKGIPVKWTIEAEESDINGCNNRMIIKEYNIEITFKPGNNVIEFTPTESGVIPYSCWMNMIKSTITVVDDLNHLEAIVKLDKEIRNES